MTKEEFGQLLINAREAVKRSKTSLFRQANLTMAQVNRLERGSSNYTMDNLFVYLDSIGYKLSVTKKEDKYIIGSRIYLSKVLKLLREEREIHFKDLIGKIISYATLSNLENNKVNYSIDSVLYLLDKYDATIQLERA